MMLIDVLNVLPENANIILSDEYGGIIGFFNGYDSLKAELNPNFKDKKVIRINASNYCVSMKDPVLDIDIETNPHNLELIRNERS